jgi:hypothetical protein
VRSREIAEVLGAGRKGHYFLSHIVKPIYLAMLADGPHFHATDEGEFLFSDRAPDRTRDREILDSP